MRKLSNYRTVPPIRELKVGDLLQATTSYPRFLINNQEVCFYKGDIAKVTHFPASNGSVGVDFTVVKQRSNYKSRPTRGISRTAFVLFESNMTTNIKNCDECEREDCVGCIHEEHVSLDKGGE